MIKHRPISKNELRNYWQWKSNIGKRLWEARRQRGWTLARCEQKSGVPRNVIERIELGYGKLKLPYFFHLLQALGLAMELDFHICENDELAEKK